MKDEYKLQRQDGSNHPVIWGVHISQELSDKIEKLARKSKICEGDVFRAALLAFVGSH